MDHMVFREIGMLVSEDLLSLEYLWKKCGKTVCPSGDSSKFSYHQRWRGRCKGCKKETGHFRGPGFHQDGLKA